MSPEGMRTRRKSTESKRCNESRGQPAPTLLMSWERAGPTNGACTDYVPLAP